MKVLSSFLLPITPDEKREGNRDAFDKIAFSEAVFLILPLYNSSEDSLLLLPLHPLIVSSSLRLPTTESGIDVFGEDNAGKNRGDNPRSKGADGRTGVDNPGIRTDADVGVDDSCIVANNPGIIANNLGIATDDSSIAVDYSDTTADDLGTERTQI